MKKHLLIIIFLSLLSVRGFAQDIHFSQFYEATPMRNPALVGIFSGDYKAGVNYRKQWGSISVPFQTVLASAETHTVINREVGDYLSFGVAATYDRAGSIDFNSMQVYPALNYNKAIEGKHNSYLSVGFTGGYIQRSIDLSKATFSSQYTLGNGYSGTGASGETFTSNKMQYFDVGAGMSINSAMLPDNRINYYLGAAAFHLAKPKNSFYNDPLMRLKAKWTVNMGFKAGITEQISLTGHFNYAKQGNYQETIFGALVSWQTLSESSNVNFSIYGGVFYRLRDAIIPTIKLDYQRYSITLSYDVNTSSLRPATGGLGGYELSFFTRGIYKKNAQMGDQYRCPHFEQMMPSSL